MDVAPALRRAVASSIALFASLLSSGCPSSPQQSEVCGNGKVEAEEECDGADLDNQTCHRLRAEYAAGVLRCTSDCRFDFSDCTGILISAGVGHSCAVLSDRTVWCWGSNIVHELGDSTTTDSSVPVQARLP